MIKTETIGQQIMEALDGRPVRWLVFKAFIHEPDLHAKIKGKREFTDDELDRINKALKTNIKK